MLADSMRVCLIIDGGYLDGIREEIGFVDLIKLRYFINSEIGSLTSAFYVTSVGNDARSLSRTETHYSWIERQSWITLITRGQKQIACKNCGTPRSVERGVDVTISTLAIRGAVADEYDTLLLMNGDGDLIDAMSYVRELGKGFMQLTDRNSTARCMMDISTRFINIHNVKHHFCIHR